MYLLLWSGLLLVLSAWCANSQQKLSIKAGMVISNEYTGTDLDEFWKPKPRKTFSIGAAYDIVPWFYLDGSLKTIGTIEKREGFSNSIIYFSVLPAAKISLPLEHNKLYFFAGPRIDCLLTHRRSDKSWASSGDFNSSVIGLSYGMGLRFNKLTSKPLLLEIQRDERVEVIQRYHIDAFAFSIRLGIYIK